jgi:hypothetical protein
MVDPAISTRALGSGQENSLESAHGSALVLGGCIYAGKSVTRTSSNGKPAIYSFSKTSRITYTSDFGNLVVEDSDLGKESLDSYLLVNVTTQSSVDECDPKTGINDFDN